MAATDDAAFLGGIEIAVQLRHAALASDVDGAMALIRRFVADERLGCAAKADCLVDGLECPQGLQCLMAPQAFCRLKSQLEDLCDELQRPGEIRLQRQLRHLVDVGPAIRAG
ncbi:hypothetical protein ASE08_11495 [Rhizobacter sp. Root16D2]|nr:hypothetical protein [Rhizobacter sp. Root1238]KQU79015.1 hypothetical protein ASC88_18195 [Rhizobacter sp. Root29]KQW13510.1 hypothetical protein ASC98_18415 [Rhizobacter sp. Root1238]KRB06280.1 hypothetical protein ASE08_11495 [Rhizobacter sp. Root16D2]